MMNRHDDEEEGLLTLGGRNGSASTSAESAVAPSSNFRGEERRSNSAGTETEEAEERRRRKTGEAVPPSRRSLMTKTTIATRDAQERTERLRLARRRVRTTLSSAVAAAILLAVALRGGLAPPPLPDGDDSPLLPLPEARRDREVGRWGQQRLLKQKKKEVHHHHHHAAAEKASSAADGTGVQVVGLNREGDALLDSSSKVATVDNDAGGEEEEETSKHHRAKNKKHHSGGGGDHLAKDQSSDGSGDYSKYSCDSLYRRTDPSVPGMRCDFARTCNGGDGIYAPVTFCSERYSPRTVILALALPLCLLLVVLFRILGSTAEEFFSPGLEMFSLRMGLPERFAGVTLLALGNGAPDVASTVNAILDDPKKGYLLAMGELTGAAMVIGTVVAGAVAWVAPGGRGVQFGGALVRDVLVFVLTMGVAYKCLEDRSVTRAEVWVFMGVYLGYVLVVLAADLYHRNVVEPRDREERRQRRREAKKKAGKKEKEAELATAPYPGADATAGGGGKAEPTATEDTAESVPAGEATALLSSGKHPKDEKNPAVITHLVRDRGVSLGSYELVKASQHKQGTGGGGVTTHKLERVIEAFSNYDERSRDDDGLDDEDTTGTEGEESSGANGERSSGLNGAYHAIGADGNIYRAAGASNGKSAGTAAAAHALSKSGNKTGDDAAADSLPPPIPPPTTAPPPPFDKSRSMGDDIAATSSGWPRRIPSDGTEPLVVFHPHGFHPHHHGGVMDIAHPPAPSPYMQQYRHLSPSFDEHSIDCGASTVTHDGLTQHPCAGEGARSWTDAARGCRSEFAAHWSEFWREMYGPGPGPPTPTPTAPLGTGSDLDGGGGGGFEKREDEDGREDAEKEELSDGVPPGGSNENNGWLDKFLLTCELPFTVLRKLTIPIPCDGYYSRPLVALSTALSPLWLVFYLRQQFDVDLLDVPPPGVPGNGRGSKLCAAVLVFLVPLAVGLLVARYAPSGDVPMRTSVSVPVTLWGFLVSATWLDLIADQLVGLLSYFGIVCRIPSTIMGLTVLAWGNSLQDMLANITVARKGLSNMAITACFAGPIFNMLVGLGIGFAALLNMTGRTSVPVELTPPLRMGFFFSILNGAVVIVTGAALGRRTIPKQYGIVAIVLYAAYAITSLVL